MRFKIYQILIFVCIATVSSNLFAQQGIGTETPDKSAALEIKSEKRGLLIPRVSLQSITDQTTISDGNVESLLVYNINEGDDMIPGYYYWSESENKWIKLLVEGDESGNEIETSWLEQITDDPAIENDQNIYQEGNVAIGKTENCLDATLDVFGSISGGNPADGTFGENSIAVGDSVVASGNNSVAFGYGSEATAFGAFAGGGFQNSNSDPEQKGGLASGKGAFAFGRATKAEGNYSVAMGRETQAQKISSVALGFKSRAQGSYSFVMGNYLRAYSAYEAVFGQYNAFKSGSGSLSSWNLEDPLFEIGNGTGFNGEDPNNALTILKKGWTGIGIIGINNAAKPTEMLDIGENPDDNAGYEDLHKVKIRDLPRTDGALALPTPDKIVTVDPDGVLRSVDIDDLGGNDDVVEGPWLNQDGDEVATDNEEDIYQIGSVAIGKDDGLPGVALDVQGPFRGGDNTDDNPSIGLNSFGYGKDVEASGDYSFGFGKDVEASGTYSLAFGFGSQATGYSSIAIGRDINITKNYGLAIGKDNSITEKEFAVALGQNLLLSGENDGEIALGRFNKEIDNSIFQIGAGNNNDNRKTPFSILYDGKVGIGLDDAPTAQLDIGDMDGEGNVRIRKLPNISGTANNRIVVVDNNGILKSIDSYGFGGSNGILTAGNGLSLDENNESKVVLGGELEDDTELNLNEHDLKFTGLVNEEVTNATEVLVVDSEGNLKKAKSRSELQSRGHLVCRLLLEKKNE